MLGSLSLSAANREFFILLSVAFNFPFLPFGKNVTFKLLDALIVSRIFIFSWLSHFRDTVNHCLKLLMIASKMSQDCVNFLTMLMILTMLTLSNIAEGTTNPRVACYSLRNCQNRQKLKPNHRKQWPNVQTLCPSHRRLSDPQYLIFVTNPTNMFV